MLPFISSLVHFRALELAMLATKFQMISDPVLNLVQQRCLLKFIRIENISLFYAMFSPIISSFERRVASISQISCISVV
jgi:hypothetical protein